MLTPWPAAGPALALFEFFAGAAHPAFSRLLLLGVLHPADELVARQGRDVLPGVERSNTGNQSMARIVGKFVRYPTGHPLASHEATVAGTRERPLSSRSTRHFQPLPNRR